MKRLRLSAKLALAIIPIGLVALVAAGFIAFTFLSNSRAQNETAHAATVAADAIETLKAVWDEEGQARQVYLFDNADSADDLASAIERTDDALQDLRDSTAELGENTTGFFNEVAFTASIDVRRVSATLNEMRSISSPDSTEIQGYHDVASAILAVLPKASSIVSDRLQARELSTAYYLAEGGQVSLIQEQLIREFRAAALDDPEFDNESTRASLQPTLEVLEGEFGAWALRANQTANQRTVAILQYSTQLPDVDLNTFPLRRNEDIMNTSETMAQGVADESQANAAESEREAYLVAGVAAAILLIALWWSYAVIRSVVRRVRGVTDAAVRVSEEDLPALVDALQNPNQDIGDLKPIRIEAAGSDEVGELAASFTNLHATLIDVASQQMDILRKGVSEIFVTLARRNRSLVDRQLALLDELESREEDPETLGGYYNLDHLATRMRRNAESLLVLAGSEPTRIWSKPLEVSEIIRAALGEVDDYQRVDIMALDPALVSGRAVADVAHLMSELLDNGTQFSSPVDRVRVAGLYDPDGYMLTVSDSGIGISREKISEFNALLANPPVLGLALQPTLGMYVVARLAARHGIRVQLISGSPGVTVRVLMPKALLEAANADNDGRDSLPPVAYKPAISSPLHNGARSPSDEYVAAPDDDDVVAPAAETTLPGKIKGRHEHPGRSRSAKVDREREPRQGSPFAEEIGSGSRIGELKKRVPGEALWLEQTDEAEFAEKDAPRVSWEVHPAPAETGADLAHEDGHAQEETEVTEHQPAADTSLVSVEHADSVEAEVGDYDLEADEASPSEDMDVKEDRVLAAEQPWWVDREAAEPQAVDSPEELEGEDQEAPAVAHEGDASADHTSTPVAGTEGKPVEETRSKITPVGLPVRTPGVSFRDTDETATSSSASRSGAIGIKSALTDFNDGRAMASQKLDAREDDTDEDEGRDD
ncbi:MAG: ATP-binding protein [Acidimicrobiia bacterium]